MAYNCLKIKARYGIGNPINISDLGLMIMDVLYGTLRNLGPHVAPVLYRDIQIDMEFMYTNHGMFLQVPCKGGILEAFHVGEYGSIWKHHMAAHTALHHTQP